MSDLKPGSRWRSAVCNTELAVIRAPRGAVTLQCGGHAMVVLGTECSAALQVAPEHVGGTAVGKRYEDATSGLEVLCTKGGLGSLAVNGVALELKAAKKLPSSD